VDQAGAPGGVGQHVHRPPAGRDRGRGGEPVAQRPGDAHEDHELAGQGAESYEAAAAAEAEAERDERGDPRGVFEGEFDPDVQQEERDRAHGGDPVHALGDDPLPGVEDQPVLCDESPDHGTGQEDERHHARSEVEEVLEPDTSVHHDQRDGQQEDGRRHPIGRPARPGERAVATTRVHGGNSERFGKAVPLPHSKWRHTDGYGV